LLHIAFQLPYVLLSPWLWVIPSLADSPDLVIGVVKYACK